MSDRTYVGGVIQLSSMDCNNIHEPIEEALPVSVLIMVTKSGVPASSFPTDPFLSSLCAKKLSFLAEILNW